MIVFLFKFFLFLFMVVLIWHFTTRKFLNPYRLVMMFGKKGCGKSTTLQKLGNQYLKQGYTVYSTDPNFSEFRYFPSEWVGIYNIPKDSVLLIDEVGMLWDNRQFKSFPTHVRNWFKFQRHEGVIVFMFSQSFDVDKKLRDLTDEMYLLENVFRVFSYGKRISKKWVLTLAEADKPSTIAENLTFESLFAPNSRMLTFIPKYAKKFDSHYRLGLPDVPEVYPDGSSVPYAKKKECA